MQLIITSSVGLHEFWVPNYPKIIHPILAFLICVTLKVLFRSMFFALSSAGYVLRNASQQTALSYSLPPLKGHHRETAFFLIGGIALQGGIAVMASPIGLEWVTKLFCGAGRN